MGYTWPGMKKIPWDEVKELAKKGELAGYFKLYSDGTEGMIESSYGIEDIVQHYNAGGEFGEERPVVETDEWCPHCEAEVKIKSVGIQFCPNCGKTILPCSICEDCTKECGYQEDDMYRIFNDKKRNAEFWDEIDNLTAEYIRNLVAMSAVEAVAGEVALDAVKEIVEIAIKEAERHGGKYPYVDENM